VSVLSARSDRSIDTNFTSDFLVFILKHIAFFRITTHNDDCQECDFRITHVPAYDWPRGARRPVYNYRIHYPRYIEELGSELNIHGPDYDPRLVDFSIHNWTYPAPIGFIDQVEHTYAYTLGTYGIQNEKQLSIGESTCSSRYTAKPIHTPGGKALFQMWVLTEIAMERCATARCAIQTMGDLAVARGFYGGDWDSDDPNDVQDEAGEALTISDPYETW
jgi:dipeptidase